MWMGFFNVTVDITYNNAKIFNVTTIVT